MMPLVKIDGIEYNSEDLSDDGKAQLQSIQFLDNQLIVLQNEISVFKTARTSYAAALKATLKSTPEKKAKKIRKKKKTKN